MPYEENNVEDQEIIVQDLPPLQTVVVTDYIPYITNIQNIGIMCVVCFGVLIGCLCCKSLFSKIYS